MTRDNNKSLASGPSPVRDFSRTPPASIRAFTLAEAVITILIVAILAVAASLFAVHAHSRTDNIRATLATAAHHNAFLDQLAADLRYATDVTFVSATIMAIDCPDLEDPKASINITYTHDPVKHRLERHVTMVSPPTDTLANVYGFSSATHTRIDQPACLKGLTLTLLIGSPESQTLYRYFECRNHPTFH